MNNYSTSNIKLKFGNTLILKKKSPYRKILRENSNKKNYSNTIVNNTSHNYLKIKKNESFLNNMKKEKTRRELNIIETNNNSINYKKQLKSSITIKDLNIKTPKIKEFNEVIFNESLINSSVKKERRELSNKKNNLENSKRRLYKNIFNQKNRNIIILNKNEDLQDNKKKNIYVNLRMSSKFRKAQEKWKKDYLASVIQKVFRGYIFRKMLNENVLFKTNLNIYTKKKIKDKNICNKLRKLKNYNTLSSFKKDNEQNTTYLNRTTRSNLFQKDLINLSNTNINYKTRDNSINSHKIKEILIKSKKKAPIIKINLNNNLLINNLYDNNFHSNNFNNSVLMTKINNDSVYKYFRRINVLIKLRKILKYWLEFSIKKRIIISIIKTKSNHVNKYNIKDIKSEDTYNSTCSFSEEKKIIKVEKSTKLYNIGIKK